MRRISLCRLISHGISDMRSGATWMIVDAHNVLHADPELRRLLPTIERARGELERLLAHRPRTVLVHDGGPRGERQVLFRKGLRVIYAGSSSADEEIVAWIRHHAATRVALVTRDGALARRARIMGAALIEPAALLASLRSQRDAPVDRAPPEAHEVEGWMRAFGVATTATDMEQR